MPPRIDQRRFTGSLPVYHTATVDVIVVPRGATAGDTLPEQIRNWIEQAGADDYKDSQFVTCPRSECGKSYVLLDGDPQTQTRACPHCFKTGRVV